MAENMDVLDRIKKAFTPTSNVVSDAEKAEELYWLFRVARENPEEIEIAFLREANRLQKKTIDKLIAEKGGHSG